MSRWIEMTWPNTEKERLEWVNKKDGYPDSYDPANLIDLTQVSQKNGGSSEQLLAVTYASGHAHLPSTITDAAGKIWTLTYTTPKH